MSSGALSKISPHLLGSAAWQLIRGIGSTLDIEYCFADEQYCPLANEPCIYVLWHGRMFVPLYYYRNVGVTIIVSEHRDGEIVTQTLESAGFKTVRGSTTRGGVKALSRMVKLAREGARIAFTADGPRGPRWNLQPGAVFAAAKTGVPIIPTAGSVRHAHYFNSWDRFQFPLPFSKAIIKSAAPYYVGDDTSPEAIQKHRLEIERQLTALTLETDRLVGARG